MTVDEAIATDNGLTPENGMIGEAWADWCEVGSVEVRSGRLTAVDFGVMSPESGVTVEVPCGLYRVQARIMGFGGSLGICAARALRQSEKTARGVQVGKVSVDIAKIMIADVADLSRGLTDDDLQTIASCEFWKSFGAMIPVELSSNTIQLPCIASGFGDGSYPAFSLVRDNSVVGIEVEFVKDGHVWGFDTENKRKQREALVELDRRLRKDPADVDARCERGTLLFKNGEFAAAVADLDAYLSAQPADFMTLVRRGMAAHFLKKDEEALGFLNRATEIRPDDSAVLLHRSTVLKALGRVGEAKADSARWLAMMDRK